MKPETDVRLAYAELNKKPVRTAAAREAYLVLNASENPFSEVDIYVDFQKHQVVGSGKLYKPTVTIMPDGLTEELGPHEGTVNFSQALEYSTKLYIFNQAAKVFGLGSASEARAAADKGTLALFIEKANSKNVTLRSKNPSAPSAKVNLKGGDTEVLFSREELPVNIAFRARLESRPGYHEYKRITVQDLMTNLSLRVELEDA